MELEPFNYSLYTTGKYNLISRSGVPVTFVGSTDNLDWPYAFKHENIAYDYVTDRDGYFERSHSIDPHDVLMYPKDKVSPKAELNTKYMLAKAIQANKHIEFIELVIKNTQGPAGLSTEEAIQAAYRIMILNFV